MRSPGVRVYSCVVGAGVGWDWLGVVAADAPMLSPFAKVFVPSQNPMVNIWKNVRKLTKMPKTTLNRLYEVFSPPLRLISVPGPSPANPVSRYREARSEVD